MIWLRTPHDDVASGGGLAGGDVPGNGRGRGHDADVVVDLYDPAWPVIRHIAGRLARHSHWHRTETQAFFAAKAAGWDARFGDDVPAYTAGRPLPRKTLMG